MDIVCCCMDIVYGYIIVYGYMSEYGYSIKMHGYI